MPVLRGLESKHEQDPSLLIRDTRTLGQRVRDFFQEPRNAAIVTITAMVACFFFSSFADFILLVILVIFAYSYTRHSILPFRMPKRSGVLDYNDIKPGGSNKPKKAGGITFFGNEHKTNEELWFTNEDMRTHVLIFGSTGSGKTETLLSLSYSALLQGSGFIYVDGKGDNSLFSKVFSMARKMGREDDVLLVNFMTGARDITGQQEKRLSNTLNPFCQGSSSMLSQLVVSLMDSSSASPDGDMWKGRAIGFVEAIMRLLVYMRDQGKILLDANTVRRYFALDRLEAIYVDRMFIRDGQEPVSLKDAPQSVLDPVDNYMINLPGYNKAKKGKQVSQVLEQHGFITMQLTRIFTSLADTYGHILRTRLAEVDLKDVVLNRRILVVLLPALEKSPDELSNLGKVIIATLRAMMASGLGEEVEGEYKDLVVRKPTNAPTPFMCILDEYGYYAVEGFAVVPAQARSLGFSVIFAGQDLPALQKASKEEAASIGGNTNIKIAMKIEDPTETWEFFQKTAGESYVTKVDAFSTNAQSVFNNYLDTRSASAEKRGRVDLLDLKEQTEGEMHIFFKSKIVRAKSFFANPKPVNYMRLNQHLKIDKPTTKALIEFEEHLDRFKAISKDGQFNVTDKEQSKEIDLLAEYYQKSEGNTLIDKGVNALIAYHDTQGETKPVEEAVKEEEEQLVESDSDLNLFSKVQLMEEAKEHMTLDELKEFGKPLLSKVAAEPPMALAERFAGKSEQKAKEVANSLIRDMEHASRYPPILKHQLPVDEVAKATNELADSFEKMKDGGSDKVDKILDDL